MSLVLKHGGNEEQTTLAAAAAICRVLERDCGISPSIKPVNDIMVEGKKVCGILCEAVCGQNGNIETVVVGIGMNTFMKNYTFPNDLKDTAGTVQTVLSSKELSNKIVREIINTISRGRAYFLPEYETRIQN